MGGSIEKSYLIFPRNLEPCGNCLLLGLVWHFLSVDNLATLQDICCVQAAFCDGMQCVTLACTLNALLLHARLTTFLRSWI